MGGTALAKSGLAARRRLAALVFEAQRSPSQVSRHADAWQRLIFLGTALANSGPAARRRLAALDFFGHSARQSGSRDQGALGKQRSFLGTAHQVGSSGKASP